MCKLDEIKRHTEDVKRLVRGRWDEVFLRLVPQIAPALERPGRHVTCPFHGGKDDFRVARDYLDNGKCFCTCGTWDGFGMVMFANHWDFPTAVNAIADVLGGINMRVSDQARRVKSPTVHDQRQRDVFVRETMRKWWKQTLPLDHPDAAPARRYFKSRKLGQVVMPLDDVGYHPALEYRDADGKIIGKYPALIAIVRNVEGKTVTVHRTWLSPDGHGKAPVDSPRKQFSSAGDKPVTGSAIRLDKEIAPVLHVAEGLETALAVRAIVDGTAPVWSALNKGLMQRLDIPEPVQCVVIWADRDQSDGGETAAQALCERLCHQGKQAIVMLPPFRIPDGKRSVDWNDVVAMRGLEHARNHFNVIRLMRDLEKFRVGNIGKYDAGHRPVIACYG